MHTEVQFYLVITNSAFPEPRILRRAPGVRFGGVVSECVVPELSMLGRLQVFVVGVWFLSVLFQSRVCWGGSRCLLWGCGF